MTEAVEDEESMAAGRDRQRTEAVVTAVHHRAERIKRREVTEAIGKLEEQTDLDEAQRDAVEGVADAIVSRVLVQPTERLREPANSGDVSATLRLFDLDVETSAAHGDAAGTTWGVSDDN
jgi:glutamyl-tRNA reductase